MTSVLDGRTHTIAGPDLDAGIWEGRGRYEALCGATVIAAPLISAPGPACPSCVQVLDDVLATAAADRERHRPRRSPLRLLRRLRTAGSRG